MGYFKRKVAEAGCNLRRTGPEPPWQMAAEGEIHELKRGSGRKINKMRSPKVIWDDYLKFESHILSNTALDIFELDGMTNGTNIPVETSDN